MLYDSDKFNNYDYYKNYEDNNGYDVNYCDYAPDRKVYNINFPIRSVIAVIYAYCLIVSLYYCETMRQYA